MADAVAAMMEIPPGPKKTALKGRDRFYFWAAILLLAFTLAGFARTFFLRTFFEVPAIPAYLYFHGAVLTAWFAWLVLQSSLIQTGRASLHRKTGAIGAAIAAGVVFVSVMAGVGMVWRMRALGADWDTDMGQIPGVEIVGITLMDFLSIVVWGDLAGILAFSVLVVSAIVWRNRPEVHKRFLLIASINLVGPALSRLGHSILGASAGPLLIPVVFLAFAVALVWHDLVVRRRPHWATMAGIGLQVLAVVVFQGVVGTSEFGRSVIRSLG